MTRLMITTEKDQVVVRRSRRDIFYICRDLRRGSEDPADDGRDARGGLRRAVVRLLFIAEIQGQRWIL
jgi:hypothetical protein